MKRIYLIDCPGVVPPSNNDSPEDILLRGVVRVENVKNPEQYIATVLTKTKTRHIERTYDVKGFSNAKEFLELLARKGGRLLKGGEADVDGVAKMVLNDFLRGKIPWFTPPPEIEGKEKEKGIDGRKGALGEMGRTFKLDDDQTVDEDVNTTITPADDIQSQHGSETGPEDAFKGFDEDDEMGNAADSDTSDDEMSDEHDDTEINDDSPAQDAPG